MKKDLDRWNRRPSHDLDRWNQRPYWSLITQFRDRRRIPRTRTISSSSSSFTIFKLIKGLGFTDVLKILRFFFLFFWTDSQSKLLWQQSTMFHRLVVTTFISFFFTIFDYGLIFRWVWRLGFINILKVLLIFSSFFLIDVWKDAR